MSCREFIDALDGLLLGALDREEHARCVDHVASCSSCRELVEPMGPLLDRAGAEPPASLLTAVLAQTSGATRRTRWAETWHRWMLRPRFAAEAAYVGVAVLSLAVVTLDRSGIEARDTRARARVVYDGLRSEAGALLNRASTLWEKEKP